MNEEQKNATKAKNDDLAKKRKNQMLSEKTHI